MRRAFAVLPLLAALVLLALAVVQSAEPEFRRSPAASTTVPGC